MNRAKLLEQISTESETYFEWPSDDRRSVSLTSCILFAEHIADQQTAALRARIAELETDNNLMRELIALPQPVPEGWKPVPVEPTEHMANVFRAEPGTFTNFTNTRLQCADFRSRYLAMLAAAPEVKE